MMETIFVLLIVFILLGLALIFYANYSKNQNQKSVKEKLSKQAIEISLKSSLLPELQCSREGEIEPNCVDATKLRALKLLIEPPTGPVYLYYYDIFQNSNITLTFIYPPVSGAGSSISLYSSIPPNSSNRNVVTIPITIQDFSIGYEQNYFGILSVQVYS